MIVLETERLLLRRLMHEDSSSLALLYSDLETMLFFGGPRSPREAEEEIAWCRDSYERNVTTGGCGLSFWATVLKSDGSFIGRCGLLPMEIEGKPEAEVAYMIARSYCSQGFATEAARAIKEWGFQHYTLPRLISTIVPGNVASIRVAEKNGMQYEKDVEVEGVIHHLYCISRDSPWKD